MIQPHDPAEARKPERPGPVEVRDPLVRQEVQRAAIWLGMTLLIALVILLADPLLLIFGGIVFAAILDGGTRLLGRVLPIGRGWRLAIVALLALAFLVGTFWFAGVELAGQAGAFRETLGTQSNRIVQWLGTMGVDTGDLQFDQLAQHAMSGLGRVTSAVSGALGALTSLIMVLVIGLFIAVEPRLYQRGFAWMLPMDSREGFYRAATAMGSTLRRLMAGRLLGMAVEGFGTGILLWIGGVPMAALLGLLTGLFAFLPNIGAIISGVMVVLVGFSVDVPTGFWAVGVYLIVQFVDGYLIVPFVAKKTVDLAPALVLGAQLMFGALFGIVGLTLADPIVAMIKTGLERISIERRRGQEIEPDTPPQKRAAKA
jgi:predicted PurR-regulated permease PerM